MPGVGTKCYLHTIKYLCCEEVFIFKVVNGNCEDVKTTLRKRLMKSGEILKKEDLKKIREQSVT